MTKKINSILKQVLEKVEPSKEELDVIDNSLKEFLEKFKKKLKTMKIDAEVFVGGSFAKKTVIKKDNYDADIFLRFNKKYGNEISILTGKILKNMKLKKVLVVHGSRDYFQVKINPYFFIEIIPVLKVKNPKQAENITDLSYSHVKYINKKIKSTKLLDEIKIAKAFCYANHCYGAESYIKGFSGYALELLIYHYGSFLKFIKTVSTPKGVHQGGASSSSPSRSERSPSVKRDINTEGKIKDKTVLDIEKHHKNKQAVLMDLNSSKLQSPIILIDPTYKQRNVLAALSEETFEKFKKDCSKFLKSPSIKSFEIKKTDLEKIKQNAEKKNFEFILIETKTEKQEGDVAGSKLLKFYKHLNYEIEKFFDVKNKGFNYNHKKSARCFFVVKNKSEILFQGPNMKDERFRGRDKNKQAITRARSGAEKNVKEFKKKHKNYFTKKNRIYAKEKIRFNIKGFIDGWKKKNKKKTKEMYIEELKVVE